MDFATTRSMSHVSGGGPKPGIPEERGGPALRAAGPRAGGQGAARARRRTCVWGDVWPEKKTAPGLVGMVFWELSSGCVMFGCWFVCLLACLFACWFVCLLACLFACWFVCLLVCLLVCLFVCLFVGVVSSLLFVGSVQCETPAAKKKNVIFEHSKGWATNRVGQAM